MNRLSVLTVGGKLGGWARDAEIRYCRLLRNWKPQVISIRAGYGATGLEDEGKRLLERIQAGSTPVVCLTGVAPLPNSWRKSSRTGWSPVA